MAGNTLKLQVLLDAIDRVSEPLKRITGGSNAMAKALGQSRKELKRLEQIQQQVGDFRKLKLGTKETSAALQQAQAKLQLLSKEMHVAGTASKALSSQHKKAKHEVAALTAKHTEQQTKLNALRSALGQAGVATTALATHERKLKTDISTANQAIDAQKGKLANLAQAQDRARKMHSGGMTVAAHGAGLAYGGYRAAQVAASPVAAAMEFESAMADVRKVVDFDTPQQFKQMGYDIQNLSMRIPMVSEDIAKMVAFAGQALGQDTAKSELLRFAEDASKMGVAFDMSAEDAGQTMATWRTAFRLGQDDAVKLADQVNYLGNTGPANAEKITAIINRIGALGEVAGLQSAPLAALGATIAGMGVQDEVAATGIKNLLLRLTAGSAATKRQRDAFKALRMDAVNVSKGMQTDAKGTILEVLERIQKLPKNTQSSILGQLFGTESVNAIAPLLTNLDLVRENLDKVSNAQRYSGSMEAEFASRASTAANSLDLLGNSVKSLSQRAGETLLPVVADLAKRGTDLFSKFADWAKENPKLTQALLKFAIVGSVVVAALGGLLVIGGTAAMALGNILSIATKLSGGALLGVGTSATALLAPLALIAGIGLLIWKYWQPIKAFLGGMWDGFLEGTKPIMPVLGMLGETLKKILTPANASKETLAGFASVGKALGTVLGWVVTAVVVPLGLALQGIAEVFTFVGTVIGHTIGAIVSGFSAIITVIKGIFTLDPTQVVSGLLALWENVNQFFLGLPAKFVSFGVNMVQGLVNGIRSMLGAPGKAFADIADGAIVKFKNLLGIKSPSRVFAQLGGFTMAGFTQGLLGGEGGAQAALGRIGSGLRKAGAGMAIGTLTASTALAANIDHRPPLALSAGAMGGGGAATYNITINAPTGAAAQDIAALVRAEIERIEHRRSTRRRSELSDYD